MAASSRRSPKLRQRRLTGVDEIVLSLYAKGLTTGEISAHFAEIYGASVSKETVSRITDKVMEEMAEWANRPLDQVYAAIFIDAIMVKVRDGQVANRPIYAAIGVSLAGEKDVLGLWAGTGGGGAKFWLSGLTDLKNRGVADVFFLVCDGLKGLPDVVGNVWPLTTVPTCIIHLIRNTFRLASKRDWDRLKRDVKLIYAAPNEPAARAGLDELTENWGARYPAMIRLWENAWTEFIPFLDYDLEIRIVICPTDEIVKPLLRVRLREHSGDRCRFHVVLGFSTASHPCRRAGAVKMQRPAGRTILTVASTGISSAPEEPGAAVRNGSTLSSGAGRLSGLPVRDEHLIAAFGLFGDLLLLVASLLVVVTGARGAVVAAP